MNDKFVWKPGDITIIPPTGQIEILKMLKGVITIEDLQRVLPDVEEWMANNPSDFSVAQALIEVTDEL